MYEKTLRVPADIYDEGLAFVNARRAENGLKPRKTLPAGYKGRPNSCPCANACGPKHELYVWSTQWSYKKPTGFDYKYGGPRRFVKFFDEHAIGGLLTRPVRTMKKS